MLISFFFVFYRTMVGTICAACTLTGYVFYDLKIYPTTKKPETFDKKTKFFCCCFEIHRWDTS